MFGAVTVASVGALVLAGWWAGIDSLISVQPGLASMQVNTAGCLLLTALGLGLTAPRTPPRLQILGRALAGLALAVAVLTLLEYVTGASLGIDQVLGVSGRLDPATVRPGRMAGATALCLTLSACSVVIAPRWPVLAQWTTLPVVGIALVALVGYLLDVRALYSAAGFSSMALHTAASLLLLSLAMLASLSQTGFMRVFSADSAGGIVFRRMTVVPLLLILSGWLALHGSRAGWYDPQFRLAIMVVAGMCACMAATGLLAKSLDRSDRLRLGVVEQLRTQLQRSALASAIVDGSEDAVISKSPDGTILSWNSSAERIFGYAAAEMTGSSILRLFPEDRIGEEAELIGQIRMGRRVTHFQTRRIRKDGTLIDVSVSLSPIRDENGEIFAVSKIARDITAEVQRRDRELAAAIVEHSHDAMVSCRLDGTVLSWNRGAERLFGYSAVEMVGQPISRLFPAELLAEEASLMERMAAGKAVENYETRRLRRDGSALEISVSLSPIRDETGAVVAVSKIARDISERIALQRQVEHLNEDLQQILEHSPVMIGLWDSNLICRRANQAYARAYGLSPEGMQGHHAADVLGSQVYAKSKSFIDAALAGENQRFERATTLADGSTRYDKVEYLRDSRPGIPGLYVFATDVTELKTAEFRLAEQHELLRITLESIGDAVITTDHDGCIQWLNPVASRLTGWQVEEAQGRPIDQVLRIVHEDTRQPAPNPVKRATQLASTVGLAEHTVLIGHDGTERAIEDSAAPIRTADGTLLGVVLVFHDVSEQRRLAKEVTLRATLDPLTGLLNRSEFELRLQCAYRGAHEEGHRHALMYIDLDHFKLVNDACGHSVGDQLLRQVANLLQQVVRNRDTLARLGGDEFAVIMEHCTAPQAQRVAEQICQRMEEFRFLHDGRRFRIGTSIGLVPLDDRWTSQAAVMQAADLACYAAKEGGRNRVHQWLDTDLSVRQRKSELRWAARLEQAFDHRRFRLYAQRIVPLKDCAGGIHCEVLLRLLEPDGSVIAPGAFLPAAERFNMATRIDRWVLREVVARMEAGDLREVERVYVNVSTQSIGDRSFHRFAAELVQQGDLDPSRLCLELPEVAAVTQIGEATAFVHELRALKVKVALDDFGAGAASFGYLKSLAVDVVKIGGQYVRDILSDPLDRTAICCFRDVAAICGHATVAESVESREIQAELRAIGIDFAQGFLMHEPEPLDDLIRSNRGPGQAQV